MKAAEHKATHGLEAALLKGLDSPKKPVGKTYFKTLRKTLYQAGARLGKGPHEALWRARRS